MGKKINQQFDVEFDHEALEDQWLEGVPYEFDDYHRTAIRPTVFGESKFGSLEGENPYLEKQNGQWVKTFGEATKLVPSRYWTFMNQLHSKLYMRLQDKFIIELHLSGKSAAQINRALKANPNFVPYKNTDYVRDRIQALIRKFLLASTKQGKQADYRQQVELAEQSLPFKVQAVKGLIVQKLRDLTRGAQPKKTLRTLLKQYENQIIVKLYQQPGRSEDSIATEIVASILVSNS